MEKEKIKDIKNIEDLKGIMDPILKKVGYTDFNWNEVTIDCKEKHERPEELKNGEVAVYIFKYKDKYLKIGKVGENSNNRFRYQHYNPNSCNSNLALQLLKDKDGNKFKDDENKLKKIRDMLPKSFIVKEDKVSKETREEISEWIFKNTTRTNIYFNLSNNKNKYLILSLFEIALQCYFNPIYEENFHISKNNEEGE